MASRTTDLVEQAFALLCHCAARELRIPRRRFRGSNKTGEVIDVGKTVGSRCVIRLRNRVADVGDLIRLQAVGDAHFIEVRIAGERQQARVLVFPTEPAHAHLSGSFHDRDLKDLSADFPMQKTYIVARQDR